MKPVEVAAPKAAPPPAERQAKPAVVPTPVPAKPAEVARIEPKREPPKPEAPKAEAPKPAPAKVDPPKPKDPPPAQKPAAAKPEVPKPAGIARMELRHKMLALSFLLCVLLPIGMTSAYLFLRAGDQYASTVGFAVRTEDSSANASFLSGIAGLTGSSSSSDTDILYRFIQSPDLVGRIDRDLDLRAIYSPLHGTDPWFALDPEATREDLLNYWNRMVAVSYDNQTGLIEVRVNAFDPDAANRISATILEESTALINQLTSIAREDATRYAHADLALAQDRVRAARLAVAEFRSRTQMVDPTADVAGQMTLLSSLQGQLAAALIEQDLLTQSGVRSEDPRWTQAQRRIAAIEERVRQERAKLGAGQAEGTQGDYAANVGEFERLRVEQEFAEKSYVMAMATLDNARAEAQRKSRYLAAYQQPTLAETAEYPRRFLILGMIAIFVFLGWSVGALIYYAVRDRR